MRPRERTGPRWTVLALALTVAVSTAVVVWTATVPAPPPRTRRGLVGQGMAKAKVPAGASTGAPPVQLMRIHRASEDQDHCHQPLLGPGRRCNFSVVDVAAIVTDPHTHGAVGVRGGERYCEVALLHTDICDVAHETAAACIVRIGHEAASRHLSSRCTESDWFTALPATDAPPGSVELRGADPVRVIERAALPAQLHGLIERAQTSPFVAETTAQRHRFAETLLDKQGHSFTTLDGRGDIPGSGDDMAQYAVRTGPVGEDLSTAGPRTPYVLPADRPEAAFPPPRVYRRLGLFCPLHRLPMAIPAESIVPTLQREKVFDFYPMVPHRFPVQHHYPLGRHDEAFTHELYRRSFFALTHRRGCWGAQRHYDILAAGAVPFFPDLDGAEDLQRGLPMYPADLVLSAMANPGVAQWNSQRQEDLLEPDLPYGRHTVRNFRRNAAIDPETFDRAHYDRHAELLLAYTKANLTTAALATHFLRTMRKESARRVFLSENYWLPDATSLSHGLAALGVEVFMESTAIVPKFNPDIPRDGRAALRDRYLFTGHRANGFGYANRWAADMVQRCAPAMCRRLIARRHFDLVVVVTQSHPKEQDGVWKFWPDMERHYVPAERAIIDSSDSVAALPTMGDWGACRMATLFSRESPVD